MRWICWYVTSALYLTATLAEAQKEEMPPPKPKPLEAKCPLPNSPTEPNYCTCGLKTTSSGRSVTIKCDFQNEQDVILTKALYPFRNSSLISAYVRMVNATSVHVTSEFLREWQQAPSTALDIWRGGILRLDSTPALDNIDSFSTYKTFVGIGIVSCNVLEIPPKFMRDRNRGGFRVKSSKVNVIRTGFLHNIKEMRYLVIEDSKVKLVDGPVATEGFVTLSQRQVHSWNGLLIINASIDTVKDNAFNLTHKSDIESADIINSTIKYFSNGGLHVVGDVEVTIKNNRFGYLETEAFKIKVTGEVKFDDNVIEDWQPDALEGLMCHNRTTLERNTVMVDSPQDIAINGSFALFHSSCGNPQLFLILHPLQQLVIKINTSSTWALGVMLLFILSAVTAGVAYVWKNHQGIIRHYYRGRGSHLSVNGLNASEADANTPDTPVEATEGVTNPMYRDDPS